MQIYKSALPLIILLGSLAQSLSAQEAYITKEIEYKTEDGWTISGTLRLPPGADANNEYPGIVLLHMQEHDRNDFVGVGEDPGLAQKLPVAGMASLNIDLRGRGLSMGEGQPVSLERHDFATQTNDNTYMDVKGAMEFLADYPGVDAFRIGIVANQYSAEYAVRAMQKTDIPTRSLVLLSGDNISQESKDYLATLEIPIFTGASIVDKRVLKDMVDIYASAWHPNSYLLTPFAAERGYNLLFFEEEGGEQLGGQSRMDHLIAWLGTNVKGIGRNRAITLTTKDGFKIEGNFRYPDSLGKDGKKIPGLVVAPGGRSNRYSYYAFEEDLARRGIAVVSVEQRGRGNSMMGLTVEDPKIAKLWLEMPEAEGSSPYELDVVAAIDYLVSQPGIDPNNIALMGGARGTRNATLAAAQFRDQIKAMVLMSVYYDDEIGKIFSSLDNTAGLLIVSDLRSKDRTIQAQKAFKNSDLLVYPLDGQTHHIRFYHPEIVDTVGDFLERELIK